MVPLFRVSLLRGLAGLMSEARERMEAAAEAEVGAERAVPSSGGRQRGAKRGSFLERCKHQDPPAKRQALAGFKPSSVNQSVNTAEEDGALMPAVLW